MSAFPIRITLVSCALALGLAQAAHGDPIRAADVKEVHAEFVSAAGESGVQSVRMYVDGEDVSASARAGRLRVGYTPTGILTPGTHSARVVVVDSLGRTFEKEWTFEVAEETPEIVTFWSDALEVELDPLPRSVRSSRLRVSGLTQPGVEVTIRTDDGAPTRVVSDAAGRFVAHVDLDEGENRILVGASRPATGEDGPEVERRVEVLVAEKPDVPAAEDPPVVVAPPRRAGADDPIGREGTRPDIGTELPVFTVPGPPAQRLPAGAGEPVGEKPETQDVIALDPVIDPPKQPVGRERTGAGAPVGRAIARPDIGALDPVIVAPEAEVVITKPDDGETLHADHVTVLGRAPAGWRVTVTVDDVAAGSDVANPAGRFTVPRVEVGPGEHELVAEATSPDGESHARSQAVVVEGPSADAAAVSILLPARTSSVVRTATVRVEGTAWDGAQVEVEVNGRVVANDFASASGRFSLDVPLEPGTNLVAVETHSIDGAAWDRSQTFFVTSQSARRMPARVADPVGRRGVVRGVPDLGAVVQARPRR